MGYESHVFANSDLDYVTNLNNLRADAEASASRGWITPAGTFTYASATEFTCADAEATPFTVGTRVRFNGPVRGTVTGVVSAAGTTTVTVAMDSGAVPNPITAIAYGMLDGEDSSVPPASGSFAATGANSDITALNALTSGTPFRRNFAINGGMIVAQSPAAAPSLTGTATYGKVDGFAAWASSGTVTNGTITQASAASVGTTGYALQIASFSLSGSGTLNIRQRLEALDAGKLRNKTISISCRVYHDVGADCTATLVVRKPTASDNYASTSTIGTSSGQTVASTTDTQVTFEALAAGDCGNGLEVELQLVTGAVGSKNFYVTEWQVEVSPVVTTYAHDHVADTLQRCQRYYQVMGGVAGECRWDGLTDNNLAGRYQYFVLPVEMRAAPTATKTGTWSVNGVGQPSVSATTKRSLTMTAASNGTAASNAYFYTSGSSDYVTLDARL